ncbi:hypothetical protein PG301_27300 [Parageobacillus sp. G301]|jgi:hypothetical protein|uniref:Uncharacterized protein n=2 Tax=Anoxybacillaceae TaxID=3120669 RepID=A0AA89NH97_9BACL|nr:hypothetical protein [Parageobacillus toebii NBRC 107807]GLH64891.1 hypothetical protein PG301_27300 [Parageobacillus sp. G301]
MQEYSSKNTLLIAKMFAQNEWKMQKAVKIKEK